MQLLLISFFSMMAFVMMESTFAIFLNDTFRKANGQPFGAKEVGYFFGYAGIIIIIVQGGLGRAADQEARRMDAGDHRPIDGEWCDDALCARRDSGR